MERFQIPEKIQSSVYRRRKAEAIWLISKLISEIDKGLYVDYYREFVRFLNNYRIRLLIEWEMYREALAFICLECELYPENSNALAYKEYFKKHYYWLLNDKMISAPKNTSKKWKGVAGMHELKTIFERDVILLFNERDIYKKFKVPLPNGIILYGPPGCGKTFIARKLSEQIGMKYMEISPADIGSTYVHGTQIEIKRLFEEAAKNSPTLLLIDEIEALVPNRTNSDVSFHYKSEVNEFLTQLDQCNKKGIFVVGTTNYLRNIDNAILRPGRFDKKIFVGTPDLEARIEAFKIHLDGRPHANIKWLFIGEMTEYYTFAEIEYIVNEASRLAIERETIIDTNILGSVISNMTPSLNDEEIKEYFK
ncbi:MAG: ATP-binding protein [Prolixibacteraceae bacterium]|nr:ATP-binding protein [Prolixibacteraceae bacterium]